MIIGNPIIAAGSGGSAKDHTFDVPTVSGSYTYNTSQQSVSLDGYYSDFMTLSGDISATNAGTYSFTVSLKDTANCQWRDGSTTSKNLSWTIAKATPSTPILTPDTINLNTDDTSATFTVTRDGNGTITVTPSDPAITTVLIGTEVTVTLVDTTVAVGTTFTVNVAVGPGDNYLPYVGVLQCTVDVVEAIPQGYIVFESEDGTSITVGKIGGKTWNGTVYYSTDGSTWSEWDGVTSISDLKVYLRGTGNTVFSGNGTNGFELSGTKIKCGGRLDSLLDYDSTIQGISPTMATYCFRTLFRNCTSLIQAPVLPAMTLAAECYQGMFSGCTSLTSPPSLPATNLSVSCYTSMFFGCNAMTKIPRLPGMTLVSACYLTMFSGCSKIKLSLTQNSTYTTEYRIPSEGTGVDVYGAMSNMFTNTGGTFTGDPSINTTYYTSNEVV